MEAYRARGVELLGGRRLILYVGLQLPTAFKVRPSFDAVCKEAAWSTSIKHYKTDFFASRDTAFARYALQSVVSHVSGISHP